MKRPSRSSATASRVRTPRALAAACLLACSGCAAAGGGTALPWCQASLRGEIADVEPELQVLTCEWPDQPKAKTNALLACLAEGARRRGFRVGAEDSARGSWAVTVTEGGPPPGAIELPPDRGGYAAALAEQVRRASARAVPPTRATVQLHVRKFGVEVWTGEARFDPDGSQPADGAAASVRMLLALLPGPPPTSPSLPRVAADSVVAYYREHLEGRTFACPVLPYPVRFPDLKRAYLHGGRDLVWEDTVNANLHDDPTVLAGVLDLVEWANEALPQSIPGYVDLAGAEIWRDVTLFDTYRGEDGSEVALEVHLKGDTRGYEVAETRVLAPAAAAARRAEAARFAEDLVRYMEHTGR